jgi:hypothetical protein
MMVREPERQQVPLGAFCKPPNWRELLRDDPVEQAALQWREIVSYILDQRKGLGEYYHQFRYEDLCQDVRGVLGRAFAFAGLSASSDVLDRLPPVLPMQNLKWQRTFSPAQIETLSRVQGPLLRQLGYEF